MRSPRVLIAALFVVALVVSALIPALQTVFVVLAIIAAFLLLGAFIAGPGRVTGANEFAMFRDLRRTDAGEEAEREYAERHRV